MAVKNKRIFMVIDEELLSKAKETAWLERKSLSELIRELLKKHIKQ